MTRATSNLLPGFKYKKFQQILLVLYTLVWTYYAFDPLYRPEWLLENSLVFLFLPLLFVTYKKYQLSDLSYLMLTIFMLFHVVGSHYGYSDVPIGFKLKEMFGLFRNPYDRIVHFSYGLLFAYPIYELLLRYAKFKGAWLYFLPISFILSLSAVYEIIEAVVAWTLPPEQYNPFIGLQGDIWDGFKDMLLALAGVSFTTICIYLSDYGRSQRIKNSSNVEQ
jgi:putative membrane protein